MINTANLSSRVLSELLEERRARVLQLLADLSDEQMLGARMRDVEPPIWEMGHVGWFQEYWILRHLDKAEPIKRQYDALYESSSMYTHQRWDLSFPSTSETLDYISTILRRCVERLSLREPTSEEVYYYLLCIFHEDMHSESLTFTRQTLGYSRPSFTGLNAGESKVTADDQLHPQDVAMPGGTFLLGAVPDTSFVFDNEKWAHPVEVAPFSIAAAPVTNAEFLEFVVSGGYRMKGIWGKRGREWLRRTKAEHPRFWCKEPDGEWYRRDFDQTVRLEPYHPVVHVSWYEANAYCNWANRRLPSEAEWEMAASFVPTTSESTVTAKKRKYPWGDQNPSPESVNMNWTRMGCLDVRALSAGDNALGCRQLIGNVWEWTADTFFGYPGFEVDPYQEYSAPSFGKKKVLRGGSWATPSLLIRNTWRNFYMPFRNNIYAGFRTCAAR